MIIAPNLCSPIILGLPFFICNQIVLDPSLNTAKHKPTEFDLLNEDMLPLPPPPHPHHLLQCKQFKEQWKACITELKQVCDIRQCHLEMTKAFEQIKPINYIASIKATIECLAIEDTNNKLAEEIMNDFKDIFKPISHANLLPTDLLVHIPLKDKYKPLKTHKYSVPQAACPKFKELINLHLAQGFI